MMKIEEMDLPLVRAHLTEQARKKAEVMEGMGQLQKLEEELRAFLAGRYGIDIKTGNWDLDVGTGEINERA